MHTQTCAGAKDWQTNDLQTFGNFFPFLPLLGVGTVPVGKIESGVLKPGMTLMFSPAKLTAEVKSIEMHHQGLETALPGHNVGFNIKNVAVKNLRRGDVAGNAQQDPPSDVSSFEAQVCSPQPKLKPSDLFFSPPSLHFSRFPGDHPESSREDPRGLLSSPGLPHCSCDLSLRRAEGEASPSHRPEAGGPAAGAVVWRCCHSHSGPYQAHVCGKLLHLPTPR